MAVSYDCICTSDDNKFVFVVLTKKIYVYDFVSLTKIAEIPNDDSFGLGYVTLSVSKDNRYLVTGPEFGLLRVWDLQTLNILFVVDCYTRPNFNIANALTMYCINDRAIITFDSEKAPYTYQIVFPEDPIPDFTRYLAPKADITVYSK